MKRKIELKLIMKTKLQSALKSNVDPFFFALSCAMLICISFTAKVLADDVLGAMSGAAEISMMTPAGELVWAVD
jgi:hypothetical protein